MQDLAARFIDRVQDRSLTIGIYGLGYVGVPLALSCSGAGFKVIGFDVDAARCAALNEGKSPIRHLADASIETMSEAGFHATTNFELTSQCDALVICVPTPLNQTREPDLSYVKATMASIEPHLRAGQLLALESTTWPGTTDEILLPYVERVGLSVGEDFFLVYSPEREDPGNAVFHTQTIPKVLGGLTQSCLRSGVALYEAIVQTVVPVSSTRAAEMVKLLENIHRSVNIGLVNEIKIICDAMGLDVFEIIDAAATKPFGFTAYYPGPGIGGHCIPIDPFYLTWKAREFGVHTRFIELAGEINASMPQYVVDKTVRALNDRNKSMRGAKILACGIAYKRDVDDMRESPSVFVMELLREWGAEVHYSDPNVLVFPKMREHKFDLESIALDPLAVAGYDAVILLTDHTSFDYEMLKQNAQLIIDTRGKYRERSANNVVRA